MTGERDIRSEDRQLLLDAIGAATEKLVITYTGANEYSGQRTTARGAAGRTARHARHHHAGQGPRHRSSSNTRCSPSTLAMSYPASSIPGEPFTFDPTALRRARSPRRRPRRAPPPFISGPLPAPPPDDVALADLVAFFRDPVKGFFRALDYTLPWDVDGVEDAMPVDIDALEEWTVGDRMLRDMLARHGSRPGAAGGVAARHAAARPAGLAQGHRDPRPGRARCRGGPTPTATSSRHSRRRRHRPRRRTAAHRHRLPGLRRPAGRGDVLQARRPTTCSSRGFRCWRCSLSASAPATGRRSCIGRPKRGTTPRSEAWAARAEAAVDVLPISVRVYDEGRREPLPLPVKTSYAWAGARSRRTAIPTRPARCRWRSNDHYPGEDPGAGARAGLGLRRVLRLLGRSASSGRSTSRTRLGALGCGLADARAERWPGPRDETVRSPGSAARRAVDDGAGGQRRDRQDVHARRLWSPATSPRAWRRWTRCCSSRSAARPRQELRERVRRQIVAGRAGVRRPTAAATTNWCGICSRAPPTNCATAADDCATRWRTSTPPRSPPRTSSANWSCDRLASQATPTPGVDAGGEPRRAGRRDRRRPVPRGTSAASATTRCWPTPTRCGWPVRSSTTRRPSCGRKTPTPTRAPRSASASRKMFCAELEMRKRRRGILGYDDLLSRLADALDADDAPAQVRMQRAVADRDGRRVPGHRSGAVEGDRPGVHRPIHADPDRRSQAGHLRVPRRRHRHLPDAAETAGDAEDTGHELAQRRRAGRPRCRRVLDGAELGDPTIIVRTVDAAPRRSPAGRRPIRRPVPAAGGAAGRRSAAAGLETIAIDDLRRPYPRDLAADIGELLTSRRHLRRRAARAPATSR